MFFTAKKENKVIDFLANMSAITECATENQTEALFSSLDTYSLKIFKRFLRQRTAFSNSIPSSQGAHN